MIPILDRIALTTDKMDEEVEFLIEGFLAKGLITMYYADGGNAKTWVSNAVAAHLCENNLAKVVYHIDMDNSLITVKERKIDEKLIGRFHNFKFIHKSDIQGTYLELFEELASKDNSKRHAYKDMVLIIDSLRNITNLKNDERAMYMMNLLTDIRDAGMTILCIAHSNKDGKNYEGSNNIKNSLDVMFKQSLLQRVMGEYLVVGLKAEKERSGIRDCDFRIDVNSLKLTHADPLYSRMSEYESEFVEKGKEVLLKNPDGLGQTELLKAIGYSKTDRTARDTLDKYTGVFWKKEKINKQRFNYTLI